MPVLRGAGTATGKILIVRLRHSLLSILWDRDKKKAGGVRQYRLGDRATQGLRVSVEIVRTGDESEDMLRCAFSL